MAREGTASAPGVSEWMKVVSVGQLTRDAVLKTRAERDVDRKRADEVAALRGQNAS